jgi:hypothetical protein
LFPGAALAALESGALVRPARGASAAGSDGEGERAREFAEAFASRGFKDLPEAVRAAFGDAVFALMEDKSAAGDKALRLNLAKLGLLLAKERKLDIDERKVAAPRRHCS